MHVLSRTAGATAVLINPFEGGGFGLLLPGMSVPLTVKHNEIVEIAVKDGVVTLTAATR